ncbi:MAG TPA: mucoidy inhibitor MuiA family protein [Spirochaetota bacterium]|nr:mucoidy inhibitor MuiA family protein [Spirochaetota bacterium]HPJ39729.1 mucoidy inhibitor MuiA family protein [Spirochaetota bacterium]HPQ53725.1 mucoidy inhibitor MuiA family protein [Spirochaetota bacterium]
MKSFNMVLFFSFFSGILLTLVYTPGFAQDTGTKIRTKSVVTSVVLYKDRAAVERTAVVSLPEGYSELVIPKLPHGIMDDTVRIQSRGNRDITIMGIEVEKKYLVKSRQKRIRELEEKIEILRNRDNALVDTMNAAKTSIRFLESLTDFASKQGREGILYKTINLAEMTRTMQFVETNILKEQAKIRRIVIDRKEISDKIRVLEKRLTDIAGRRYMEFRGNVFTSQSAMLNRPQVQQLNQYNTDVMQMDQETSQKREGDREKWVTISLRAAKAGPYTLKLSYVIRGARWTPLYDVRTSLKEKSVALAYYGLVRQNTGEDWNNVRLYLSTADPRRAADPPRLSPWYLTRKTGRPHRSRREMRSFGGAAGAADYASSSIAAAEKSREPLPDFQKIREKSTSVTYRVASRKTILSGTGEKKTPIEVIQYAPKHAQFLYVVTPGRSARAFLRTKITNASRYTIFPGKVNLYLDGDYVGNTAFRKTIMPEKKMTLHFGTDDGIRIQKTLVKKYREEKGLFSGAIRTSYHYRIKIENNKKKEASFLVIDRLPVSRDSAITVEEEQIMPEPLSGSEEKKRSRYKQGIRRWRFTVPALKSQTIEMKFYIQHPKEVQVSG